MDKVDGMPFSLLPKVDAGKNLNLKEIKVRAILVGMVVVLGNLTHFPLALNSKSKSLSGIIILVIFVVVSSRLNCIYITGTMRNITLHHRI